MTVTTLTHTLTPKTPWHREPWVWFIIAIPSTSIGVGGLMLYLALSSDDGLVVDDYYKQGLAINRTLERDQMASQYQLSGLLRMTPHHLQLQLHSPQHTAPATLTLKLLHATRTGFDQQWTLTPSADGSYQQALPTELAAGDWHLQVEAENWRLTGIINRPNQQQVYLQSHPKP